MNFFSFCRLCPGDRSKTVIKLKENPAIFTLDHTKDKGRDFLCHLELEVPSIDYGFHVYLAEMNLLGSEEDDCKEDFIQFGRDDLFVTTFRSHLYCGQRAHVNSTDKEGFYKSYDRRHMRLYVEERDYEMDFWIKLKAKNLAVSNFKRNLTVVVTPFKKYCSARDKKYVKCKNTSKCVKRDWICDGAVNCAWPDGDVPTDELNCDSYSHYGYANESEGSGIFKPSNIPIVIVALIVVIGVFVAFVIFCRTFVRSVKRPISTSPPSPVSSRRRDRRRATSDESEATRLNPPSAPRWPGEGSSSADSSSAPSAPQRMEMPPTYEEAVTVRDEQDLPSNPPPYSPTA